MNRMIQKVISSSKCHSLPCLKQFHTALFTEKKTTTSRSIDTCFSFKKISLLCWGYNQFRGSRSFSHVAQYHACNRTYTNVNNMDVIRVQQHPLAQSTPIPVVGVSGLFFYYNETRTNIVLTKPNTQCPFTFFCFFFIISILIRGHFRFVHANLDLSQGIDEVFFLLNTLPFPKKSPHRSE